MHTTPYQPSARVYASFDKVMCLSGGRTAFFGPAKAAGAYFGDTLGKPLPADMNAAEHLVDQVNAEFTSPASVDAILDAWPLNEYQPQHWWSP